MKTVLFSISAFVFISFLSSCGTSAPRATTEAKPAKGHPVKPDSTTVLQETLAISTFEDFPPELESCTCYFSHNMNDLKRGQYIYVSDGDKISFMTINGKRVKFTQTSYEYSRRKSTGKAESELYKLTIRTLKSKNIGKGSLLKVKGRLILTGKSGKSMTWPFYGECGC